MAIFLLSNQDSFKKYEEDERKMGVSWEQEVMSKELEGTSWEHEGASRESYGKMDGKKKMKILGTLILLVLLNQLTQVTSEATFNDGDCLSYEALNYFCHSPGGYEVAKIDLKSCSSLCGDFEYPFAGLVGKKYCLCANDVPTASKSDTSDKKGSKGGQGIKIVDSSLCDSDESAFVRFTKSTSFPGSINGLAITSSVPTAFIDDTVTFEVSTGSPTDGNIEYRVDFSDGTPPSPWSEKTKYDHIFRLPGKYQVKVHARLAKGEKDGMAAAAASFQVGIVEKFEERDLDFECARLIEPGDPPGCNITVYSGQDVSLEVNWGDESEPFAFNSSGE